MKKIFCILLMLWLPCFVMAASAMSMQMQLAELTAFQPEQTAAMADEMPCHHAHSDHQADSHAPAGAHHCGVCGFCVIGSGVARLEAFPQIALLAYTQLPPRFLATPVHSLSFPPAIKPPILL